MAIPVSTWALVAGVVASAVTVFFVRTVSTLEAPPTVVWLGAWGVLFATQAVSWALSPKRTN